MIGHGGAGAHFAGNSEASIRKAMAIGVDRIEVDLLITGDGELVLMHDTTVAMGGKHRTAVRSLTAATLRSSGIEFLTLPDLLEITTPDYPVLLDLKTTGFEDELIEALTTLAPERSVSACSTFPRSLRRLRAAFPTMRLAVSSAHRPARLTRERLGHSARTVLTPFFPLPLILAARAINADEIMVNYHLVTRRTVSSAHRANLRIYAWTVDRPADVLRLAREGIDGITSNRPDMVLQTLGLSPRKHAKSSGGSAS